MKVENFVIAVGACLYISSTLAVHAATTYDCVWSSKSKNNTYLVEYIPGKSAETSCSWKESFPEATYNDCIYQYKTAQKLYEAGKCKESGGRVEVNVSKVEILE